MGWRLRRRVWIIPGFRVNFGKTGAGGVSVGVPPRPIAGGSRAILWLILALLALLAAIGVLAHG